MATIGSASTDDAERTVTRPEMSARLARTAARRSAPAAPMTRVDSVKATSHRASSKTPMAGSTSSEFPPRPMTFRPRVVDSSARSMVPPVPRLASPVGAATPRSFRRADMTPKPRSTLTPRMPPRICSSIIRRRQINLTATIAVTSSSRPVKLELLSVSARATIRQEILATRSVILRP